MTAQNGAMVLIKAGDGGSPETFTTIGGLRDSEILLHHHVPDATTVESGAWQQLPGNCGMLSCTISGSGLFTDSASEETVRSQAFSGSASNYRFIFANGNNITGAFIVTGYHRAGAHDGVETYRLALESAGTVTFAIS